MSRLLLLLGCMLLSACSRHINVDIDYDKTALRQPLRHYAWADKTPAQSGNALIDSNSILHERIQSGIEHWFATHGYQKSTPTSIDFLVRYRIAVDNVTQVTLFSPYYGYPFYSRFGFGYPYRARFAWHDYQERYEYQQALFVIDILEPGTQKLIWRGIADEDIRPYIRPEQKERQIQTIIDAILSHFPPFRQKPD